MYVHASELRKFRYFYILKLLFLSIFCRCIRCFVGTNDMLVGLHVPTNLSMYRQISKCTDKSPKRHYWGGVGWRGQLPPLPPPPPPPSGYANANEYIPLIEYCRTWQVKGAVAGTRNIKVQAVGQN